MLQPVGLRFTCRGFCQVFWMFKGCFVCKSPWPVTASSPSFWCLLPYLHHMVHVHSLLLSVFVSVEDNRHKPLEWPKLVAQKSTDWPTINAFSSWATPWRRVGRVLSSTTNDCLSSLCLRMLSPVIVLRYRRNLVQRIWTSISTISCWWEPVDWFHACAFAGHFCLFQLTVHSFANLLNIFFQNDA